MMDNLPRKQTSGVGLSFDYGSVPEFADELRAIADRIHPLSVNLTKNIVEMGFHLEGPQGRLKQRQFDHWVKAEFGFTGRTGRNRIAAARFVRATGEIFSQLPATALYELAQASTPAEVIETVRARLAAGEVLRAHQINTVIARAHATSAQDATVPRCEVPPPCEDEPAVRQTERSQPAGAMFAPTQPTVAKAEQPASEPEHAGRPVTQPGTPRQSTDFTVETGMRQLIEMLMEVILGNRPVRAPTAETITELLNLCRLETLADRLAKYMQAPPCSPVPSAPDHRTVWLPPRSADIVKLGVPTVLIATRRASGEIVLSRPPWLKYYVRQVLHVAHFRANKAPIASGTRIAIRPNRDPSPSATLTDRLARGLTTMVSSSSRPPQRGYRSPKR
jgi:hypothetical protein